MKLIVGLGNPGSQYSKTRHNIGFILIDNYLKNNNFLSSVKKDFKSEYVRTNVAFFQKPLTYMNNSGQAIVELMNYYKIKANDLYVIYDDMDLPLGQIRIRDKGSSGGHNGIKSIISHVGDNFNRIRVGIGNKKNEAISHVLGSFSKEELDIIKLKFDTINSLIDDIQNDMNIEKIKTKYNKK